MNLLLSGMGCGFLGCFVVNPVEHLRTRIQIQSKNMGKISGNHQVYNGTIDAGKKIFAKHGFTGLQKGLVATMLREMTFFGVYFNSYEFILKVLNGDGSAQKRDLPKILLAGGLTGIVTWSVVMPIDTLKTLSQAEEFEHRKYNNFRHMATSIIRQKGFASLYTGLSVVMWRAFPVNATRFLFWETAKDLLIPIEANMKITAPTFYAPMKKNMH